MKTFFIFLLIFVVNINCLQFLRLIMTKPQTFNVAKVFCNEVTVLISKIPSE